MSESKNNEPAFPLAVPHDFQFANNGMTLRDYFAGQALIGVMEADIKADAAASWAYRVAEAMLSERAKEEPAMDREKIGYHADGFCDCGEATVSECNSCMSDTSALPSAAPDVAGIVESIGALLDLDAKGALEPHGVGGLARELLTKAATALRAQEGWRLVPVEPTPEMVGAWYRVKNGHHFHDEAPPTDRSDYAAYRAMIAAAPQEAGR